MILIGLGSITKILSFVLNKNNLKELLFKFIEKYLEDSKSGVVEPNENDNMIENSSEHGGQLHANISKDAL
jgi:hypothetical protein